MSQAEVYKILKKKKGWMTAAEIAKRLNISRGCVTISLNTMLKYNEVLRKLTNKKMPSIQYIWRIKEDGS